MSTLSIIVLIMFFIFAIYKFIKFNNRKSIEKNNKNIINKEITLDKRLYSTPSFDFPNVQSKRELKDIDFTSGFLDNPSKIKITQYCKF